MPITHGLDIGPKRTGSSPSLVSLRRWIGRATSVLDLTDAWGSGGGPLRQSGDLPVNPLRLRCITPSCPNSQPPPQFLAQVNIAI